MEFNLSDFPISKDMFDTDGDLETDSRHGVLTGEGACIVTGDSVPPSESDDPNVFNPNFPCQITACEKSFATMFDLEQHRADSHALADFAVPPSACSNNDDLKSQDQSNVTSEHETLDESHISAHESEKKSIKENSVEENSDGPSTVHWNGDPAAYYQTLAKLLISEKIRNRRPTPYWPDQMQSKRAANEASELETHNIHGRIIEGRTGHANQWRNALLFSGALILVNKFLQKLSVKYYAFCSHCAVSAALRSASSDAARRIYRHAWHEGILDAIRGISRGSVLSQFLQTAGLPYTPATPAARAWVYVIAAAAVVAFLVWKLRFRRDTPWRTLLHVPIQWWPRRSAGPRRHRLNRTANANDHDNGDGRDGTGSGGSDHKV